MQTRSKNTSYISISSIKKCHIVQEFIRNTLLKENTKKCSARYLTCLNIFKKYFVNIYMGQEGQVAT